MDRRRYLRGLGLAAGAGLAGCLAPLGDAEELRNPGLPARGATELPVPERALTRGASKDAIPAITDPVFATDWAGVSIETYGPQGYDVTIEPRLHDDEQVIGLARDGEARAYPLRVLRLHEVVNDDFDGPLAVTYCPLCRSAMVATRRVRGRPTVFGVSGYLWHSDLVLYDRLTDSLWSQVAATAIRGPMTGASLEQVPATLTSLGAWRDRHPDTMVLRPAPESDTVVGTVSPNYILNPYAAEDDLVGIGLGDNDLEDDRLGAKTTVLGVAQDGAAMAYPEPAVREAGVVNDTVGGLPVVVTADSSGNLQAYVRRLDGRTYRFEAAGAAHLRAGGSRWSRTTGEAVDGPQEGAQLARANDLSSMFWFAWSDFHPGTEIYGSGT